MQTSVGRGTLATLREMAAHRTATMSTSGRPARVRLVHVTTTDISLALLLGPQLRAFLEAGYEVIGVSAPGPYVERLREWGVPHVPLRHATRAIRPDHDVAALAELYHLFRLLRPAIVHTHNPKPGVYGRIAARIAGVPLVVNTLHGLYALPEDSVAKRTFVYTLERLAAAYSDVELVQNPEDLPVLRRLGVDPAKLTLLGNGIDLERFDPDRIEPSRRRSLRSEWRVRDDDVVCAVVGRLVWEKGYRELFEAAALLRTRNPKVRFVVTGPIESDKRDGLTAVDLARARSDGVLFLGARDDMEDIYGASDLYVLASHREGFPRSAMEASAMGLPVVATNIRGSRQVVDEGQSGFLVPLGDVTALTRAIETLAIDAPLRARMGQAGRRRASLRFDQRRIIDLTLAAYRTGLVRSQEGPSRFRRRRSSGVLTGNRAR